MNREEQTTILSALLHGIEDHLQNGKPRQSEASADRPEPGTGFIARYRDDFARCVDVDLLGALSQGASKDAPSSLADPRNKSLARLTRCAYDLASSGRAPQIAEQSSEHSHPISLAPIFDRVELTRPHSPPPRYFRHQSLTDTSSEPPIFADEKRAPSPDEAAKHVEKFQDQFNKLAKRLDWDSFDCVYAHLFSLLQSYAWCIPSGGQSGVADVSLFDRLRVTSAIAACLYKFHNARNEMTEEAIAAQGQQRCVLLTGDVSGIQEYIFDISTTGAGGVAKRLRARSFFVQLLSDAASLRVLGELKLPLANLLMASGGNFYVLLPNLPDATEILKTLQREFDEWLLTRFHGLLAINLAWTELSDSDFAAGRYGKALSRLHEKLQHRKARRLAAALQDDNRWREEFVREPFKGNAVCASCRRFAATRRSSEEEREPDICQQCREQQDLGRQLTRAKYLAFYESDAGSIACLGLSASVDNNLDRLIKESEHKKPFLVVSLNDPDLMEAAHLPATFRYIANHVPRDDDGDPLPFDKIAGNGLLGVLKADVDYLGQIFQEGLRRDSDAGYDSVSRLSALSRQLDWFFSGWLEWLLANEYADCYTVYSGGDDLLIVGPRARTLNLARRIRDEFTCYAGHPEITISAGIAVVKPRLPLAHTVKQADDALKAAKKAGRNRLSMLGKVVRWDDLAPFDKIATLLETSAPPSAFLYQLLRCGEMYLEFANPVSRNLRGLRFIPLLAETLARNVDSKKQAELFNWGYSLLDVRFRDGQIVKSDLDQLALAAQWMILGRRESNVTRTQTD